MEAAQSLARLGSPSTSARAPAEAIASPRDQTLLKQARRGDRSAFEEIVELHQRVIYGFLRARLLEPADAEDLCQEVFLRCYAGREKLARAEALGPWLMGIARNLLREHVRRQTRRRETRWTELCLELDAIAATSTTIEDDALTALPECLDSLGQSARNALAMKYESGLKLTEIGEKLRRSEGAVKLLLHRSRLAVKHCLLRKLKSIAHE